MLLTSIPGKWKNLWAQLAGATYVNNAIPQTATGGHASQQLGFPPITATPPEAGGIPPDIADFNGAFKYFSQWLQWMQAGGPVIYDATFQADIGGYMNGAVVRSAVSLGVYWMSTVDNNLTNPDAGGAGWLALPVHGKQVFSANGTFVGPNYVQWAYVEVWGGGGGSTGGSGGSGGGGGYAAGWVQLVPGQSYAVVVGAGGTTVGVSANAGGTSSFNATIIATGGGPGTAGVGGGGVGSGGQLNLIGGGGIDLTDAGTYSQGAVGSATGGGGAGPGGGSGGNLNASGVGIPPAIPAGGGGANSNNAGWAQSGAAGLVVITW